MKLRNKKTGEIADQVWWDNEVDELCINGNKMYFYNSLTELDEEWEDYEEPKAGYIIDPMEADCVSADDSGYEEPDVERAKELGIWFETKEEAEKVVEKLKAWKRLKDKGFKFGGYEMVEGNIHFIIDLRPLTPDDLLPDLDLLFSQEDD